MFKKSEFSNKNILCKQIDQKKKKNQYGKEV